MRIPIQRCEPSDFDPSTASPGSDDRAPAPSHEWHAAPMLHRASLVWFRHRERSLRASGRAKAEAGTPRLVSRRLALRQQKRIPHTRQLQEWKPYSDDSAAKVSPRVIKTLAASRRQPTIPARAIALDDRVLRDRP